MEKGNLDHEFIQNELAGKDINSSIKDNKVVVHRDNVASAKKHIKKLGYNFDVIAEEREELKTFLDYLIETTSNKE